MCRVKGTSTVHCVPQSNGRYVRISGPKRRAWATSGCLMPASSPARPCRPLDDSRRDIVPRVECPGQNQGFASVARADGLDERELLGRQAHIAQHRSRAIDVLMGCEDKATPRLEPLVMPAALYAQRRPPPISESKWIVFGDKSIFDVIPVVSKSDGSTPAIGKTRK